jgi:hypothetical protein
MVCGSHGSIRGSWKVRDAASNVERGLRILVNTGREARWAGCRCKERRACNLKECEFRLGKKFVGKSEERDFRLELSFVAVCPVLWGLRGLYMLFVML